MNTRKVFIPTKAQGFTLLECLIALSIVAIGLLACIQAGQHMLSQQNGLHKRQLANLSAQNMANWVQHTSRLPNPQTIETPCPQGDTNLLCVIEISNTANRNIRKVWVKVFELPSESLLTPTIVEQKPFASTLIFIGEH